VEVANRVEVVGRSTSKARFIYAGFSRADTLNWTLLGCPWHYDWGQVMTRLKEAMLLLVANDLPLPPEYLDHPLDGNWGGFRECHIGGDFLLSYERATDDMVIFIRAGIHAEQFY
jgi:mRNA interferase YafQ